MAKLPEEEYTNKLVRELYENSRKSRAQQSKRSKPSIPAQVKAPKEESPDPTPIQAASLADDIVGLAVDIATSKTGVVDVRIERQKLRQAAVLAKTIQGLVAQTGKPDKAVVKGLAHAVDYFMAQLVFYAGLPTPASYRKLYKAYEAVRTHRARCNIHVHGSKRSRSIPSSAPRN